MKKHIKIIVFMLFLLALVIVETDWRQDGGKWYYMGIQ